MGLVGNLAKKGAKKAGNAALAKAKHKANGGCPGSNDGKHNYGTAKLKDKITGKTYTSPAYCKNKGCGRVH
jgi:hypothetical protein